MPFNGSGGFIPLSPPDYPAVSGTTVASSQHNNNLSDVFQGLSNCITRDGQSPATANLPMGGFKFINAAAGTATGQFLLYGQDSAALGDTVVEHLSVNGPLIFTVTAVGFSATPTFDFAATAVINMNAMTAAVTNASVAGLTEGQVGVVWLIQDGTGGRTFASSTIKLTGSIGLLADQRSRLDLSRVGALVYGAFTVYPV